MADIESLVERHRSEVEAEIEKLRPQAEEYERLVAYRESMGSAPRARRSSRGSGSRAASRPNADRPQQFLDALKDNPGAKIPDIAASIGDVSANYLYRVRDGLIEEGKVRKDDDGKHYLVEAEGAKSGGRKTAGATA